jgi:hypothetical protein
MSEHDWTEQMQAVLEKDATRRPQSRFAAGVLTPRSNTIAAIDALVLELLLLKRRLVDAEQDH